ncbi:10238_t:CDS:10 [Scutellospora calospora]|uniref:10238_t:CDS:1 n=1 Tax=Scutellospora calospora TaxID=85575 RepID=A0ACA9K0W7_9GLOM|nr:10238_t:CDS:10 [Scutellospora calospora]
MKFDKELYQSQIPEWSGYYISYKTLKRLINNALKNETFNDNITKSNEIEDIIKRYEEFFTALDCEIKKVNHFFEHKHSNMKNIYRNLNEKNRWLHNDVLSDSLNNSNGNRNSLYRTINSNFNKDVAYSEFLSELVETRNQIKNLLRYANLNIKGFNKILKKFDKKLKKEVKDVYIEREVNSRISSSTLIDTLEKIEQMIREVRHKVADNEKVIHDGIIPYPELCSEDTILENDDVISLCKIITSVDQRTLISLLFKACHYKAFKCIKQLLESGVHILEDDDIINKRSIIHKLVINGGILPQGNVIISPDISSISGNSFLSNDSERTLSLPDDSEIISCILENLPLEYSQVLSHDVYGLSPLHYASINGCVEITKILLEYLIKTEQFPLNPNFNNHAWFDADGYTPLFHAVVHDHVQVVDCILEIGKINDVDLASNVRNISDSQTLLTISCKFGHHLTTELLFNRGAKPNVVNDDGETPLHLASRGGFTNCVELLINNNADKEIKLKYYGWTPLFLAGNTLDQFISYQLILFKSLYTKEFNFKVIEGHAETVKALIKSRANLNIKDEFGWTPYMHAVFRGHFSFKDDLRPSREPFLSLLVETPQNIISQQEVSTKSKFMSGQYLQDQSLIFVTLGTTDSRQDISFIEFDDTINPSSTPVSIVIWAKDAAGDKVTIDLPVKDKTSIDPIMFFAEHENINNFTLIFDIIPTYGTKKQLIGRATVMLSSVETYSGPNHTSLIGSVTIPIVEPLGLDVIGRIRFRYLVAEPFKHKNLIVSNERACWKSLSTKVIGHRGMGATATVKGSQPYENTLQSFMTAAKHGVEYVEFDCQVTKDLVPVIYHDWNISETGYDIPIYSTTLKQFRNLKSNGIDVTPTPFTTLAEAFKNVPTNVGFNIEFKYPMIDEAEEFKLPGFYTELNIFCDTILKCIYENAQGRNIIFSSFHPEICAIINCKQPTYPVFFLTDCGVTQMADARCNSVQAAIRFAKFIGLSGLVTNCGPIIEAPGLVKVIRGSGLNLFTYGSLNNNVANTQLQKRAGVDAVIVDSVLEVREGFNAV